MLGCLALTEFILFPFACSYAGEIPIEVEVIVSLVFQDQSHYDVQAPSQSSRLPSLFPSPLLRIIVPLSSLSGPS